MKNNKKIMIIVIAIVLISVIGISFAWFNYTKTGKNSELVAGDVYLTMGETGNGITLTNVFPETKEEARSRNDNYMIFSLTGKNTSDKDLYYEIKLIYGDNKPSPKERYHDTDLVFDLVELDSSNNEIRKIVDAKSYDSINNTKIWVDTINGNTTEDVTKKYMLRMWLSEDVIISDTEANANYHATGDHPFKNFYGNVKIEVFGDFTEKELDAVNKLKKLAQPDTGINFGKISSDTNGKGLYKLGNTDIVYYRGEVDNNNVIFGGFCWQIVRTTDTGGIKMIYNGKPDITGSGDNITYNCGTTREFQNDVLSTTSLYSSTGYYYADDYEIVSTEGNGVTYKLKSKVNQITQVPIKSSNASANIATIVTDYPYTCKQTNETATCTTLYKVVSRSSGTNANVYASDSISTIGNSAFNSTFQSMSDVGYMYNKRYAYSYTTPTTGAYFGSGVNYDNTTNTYTLTGADVTTPDASHHYSCDLIDPAGFCATIRYYYYVSDSSYYYIELTGGEKIEDAIYKMTGNGTSEVKARAINQNYELNNTNSIIKTAIDTWYQNNLTSYTSYLEDTVYCNDRSFQENGDNTLLKSGWNPNVDNTSGNGGLTTNVYFNAITRFGSNSKWYSTTNVPIFTCPKEEDRFTVSSEKGNGKLTYPIGLLTSDEIILAGAAGNSTSSNNKYYLYTGNLYWGLSPSYFNFSSAFVFYVYSLGNLLDIIVYNPSGVRPVVSLKSGTEFESGGDGTPTNPYVVSIN